jgi:hypothetical protein
MSSGDEVKVVVLWDALLKQSPVYGSALDIFSGKAHKATNIDTKHTLLLNILSRPSEEYFICGSRQADNFQWLKKQCYNGWGTTSTCVQVWIVLYTANQLTLLPILPNQVDRQEEGRGISMCRQDASDEQFEEGVW